MTTYLNLAIALAVGAPVAAAALVNPCSPGSPVTALQVCLTVDGVNIDYSGSVQTIASGEVLTINFGETVAGGELTNFGSGITSFQFGREHMLTFSFAFQDTGNPSNVELFLARPLNSAFPFESATVRNFNSGVSDTSGSGATLTPAGATLLELNVNPGMMDLGLNTGGACAAPAFGFNLCPESDATVPFPIMQFDDVTVRLSFSTSANTIGLLNGQVVLTATPEPGTMATAGLALAALGWFRRRRQNR